MTTSTTARLFPLVAIAAMAALLGGCTRPQQATPAEEARGGTTGRATPATGAASREPKALGDLVVVYAGEPERGESFRRLLAEHVREVRVEKVADLAKLDLSGADALIVDGTPMRWEGDRPVIQEPPGGFTLDSLSVPTILVGGIGGHVSDALELKLGWEHG